MRICDVCGDATPLGYDIGNAVACHRCGPRLSEIVARERGAKRPCNALHWARKIFRAETKTLDLMVRDVPVELMTRVRHRAIDTDTTIRATVLRALYEHLGDAELIKRKRGRPRKLPHQKI